MEYPFDISLILGKKRQDIHKIYPVFEQYPYFKHDCSIPYDKALALIIKIYSVGSPIITKHNLAKVDAAEQLGFKVKNGNVTEKEVADCLNAKDSVFNQYVIAYCRLQRNAKWSRLVTYIDGYYDRLEKFRNGYGENEKEENSKNLLLVIDQLEEKIETATKEFLNYDVDLKDELLKSVERDSLGLSPEEIAEKIASGVDILNYYPYGKNYKFEEFGDRTKVNPYSEN